jgi:membrane protease YdiL (CAAX protease family)
VWITIYEKRSFKTLGFPLKNWFYKLLLGLLIGFGMIFLIVGLMYIAGGVVFDSSGSQESGITAFGSVFLCLLIFGVQGSSEEILSRGWMLPVIGARYRPWIGISISTVIFVACHGTLQPLALINLTLFTLFLSFYCLREGGIWGVCGMHAAWNWTQAHFFGLPVTGHEQTGGTILDLKASGLRLINGGGYGPEASIMCTFILGIGVFLMLRSLKQKTEKKYRDSVAQDSDCQ